MSVVNINPGICGLISKIIIETEDMQEVIIKIESLCPYIMEMAKEIQEIDGFVECFAKFQDSKVYNAAQKYSKHVACPVPSGIIKGIEIACGLALPKPVKIDFE
ncbi:hypothetical protein G9F72_006545 [Clostridium estertheticum]|uniref:DUF6951 family protein n=1 Tax=Clostridium estertheticum TaxID=238834 RepID=UPI0013E98959|nr:hypothetical protein [Clostridium estertheticum]MBZ9685993.1 hypothetical protein [Clostridium estertheticum]